MKLRNVVWISALVLVASALAGVGAPLLIRAESGDPPAGTLSVVGTGVVKTKPDTARVSAGVTTEAAKAGEYHWRLSPETPRQFFLKLEARDAAGNIATAQSRAPIVIVLPQPTGRLRSAKPVMSASGQFRTAGSRP